MAISIELRWFKSGDAPKALWLWFLNALDRSSDLCDTESRTDRYIAVGACDQIGVKLRVGTVLEVKLRQRVLPEAWISPTVSGQPESWTKLTANTTAVEDLDSLFDDLKIHAVVKHRKIRKYQHSIGGIHAVRPSLAVPAGATVEVTMIEIGGAKWWTFGFEAFNTIARSDDKLGETFNAVVQHVLREYDGPSLSKEESYGYPCWLNVVSADM